MKSCYNCERRVVGCHSNCEDYKEFRDMIDKRNNNRHKLGEHDRYIYASRTSRRKTGSLK